MGQKYKLGRPATRKDVSRKKIPEAEFVDKQRLAEMAKATGGISEFSGDAENIAENLSLFLNALLGEYEITYTHPNAERGSKHEAYVAVTSPNHQQPVQSEPKDYTITLFGRSVSLPTRLTILGSTVLLAGLGGVVPFYYWGQWLKQAEMD